MLKLKVPLPFDFPLSLPFEDFPFPFDFPFDLQDEPLSLPFPFDFSFKSTGGSGEKPRREETLNAINDDRRVYSKSTFWARSARRGVRLREGIVAV